MCLLIIDRVLQEGEISLVEFKPRLFFSTFSPEVKNLYGSSFFSFICPSHSRRQRPLLLEENSRSIFSANSFGRSPDSRTFPSFPSTSNFLIRISSKGIFLLFWALTFKVQMAFREAAKLSSDLYGYVNYQS